MDSKHMKAERRHELQHNELADWSGSLLSSVQPYWQAIVGGLVLLVGALFVMSYASSRSAGREATAMKQYLFALQNNDVEALKAIASENPGSAVAMCAYQRIGDVNLAEGTRLLFEDRAEATEKLKEALASFEFVATKSSDLLLRQHSSMGWAQTLEATNELSQAAEKYESIVKAWPDSVIAKEAQKRLDAVKNPQTAEFMTWFYAQKPVPPAPAATTRPGTSALDVLPNDPNIALPGRTKTGGTGASNTPGGSSPPADATVQPPLSADEIDFGPALTDPASSPPATGGGTEGDGAAPAANPPATDGLSAPSTSETPAPSTSDGAAAGGTGSEGAASGSTATEGTPAEGTPAEGTPADGAAADGAAAAEGTETSGN